MLSKQIVCCERGWGGWVWVWGSGGGAYGMHMVIDCLGL